MDLAELARPRVARGRRAVAPAAVFVLAVVGALVLGAGPAAARPSSVRASVDGRGIMVGTCAGVPDSVGLTATAAVHGQYLGKGQAQWSTCVQHFGGTFLNAGTQSFVFTSAGGTLSGVVTDATLEHVIGGQCLPTNLIGQWTVRVTVSNLSGTGKFAKVTGGQLLLDYQWARADGGTCAQLPGFAALDMTVDGDLSGTLS